MKCKKKKKSEIFPEPCYSVWFKPNTPWEVATKAASQTYWIQISILTRSSGDLVLVHTEVWEALLWRVPWLTFWSDGLLGLSLFWTTNWAWGLPVPSQSHMLHRSITRISVVKLPQRFPLKLLLLPFKQGLFLQISRLYPSHGFDKVLEGDVATTMGCVGSATIQAGQQKGEGGKTVKWVDSGYFLRTSNAGFICFGHGCSLRPWEISSWAQRTLTSPILSMRYQISR